MWMIIGMGVGAAVCVACPPLAVVMGIGMVCWLTATDNW